MRGATTLFSGGKSLYVYNIDKEGEILTKDYTGVGKFFDALDKLGGRKSFGSAMLLIDGYNDVSDELCEIPEVREYVKGLFDKFPHLLYYISFELNGHHHLLASLLDYQSIYKGDRLTPEELWKKYMLNMDNIPKHDMFLSIPKAQLQKLQSAIVEHGYMMKREDLGEKLAYKLGKMFPIGGIGIDK